MSARLCQCGKPTTPRGNDCYDCAAERTRLYNLTYGREARARERELRTGSREVKPHGRTPTCTCGACQKCKRRVRDQRRDRRRAPISPASVWPPITESLKELEQTFPHLAGVDLGDEVSA